MPLTGVIKYVFCNYICCFIANSGYRTRIASKQSHSQSYHIFIFSYVAVETSYSTN